MSDFTPFPGEELRALSETRSTEDALICADVSYK